MRNRPMWKAMKAARPNARQLADYCQCAVAEIEEQPVVLQVWMCNSRSPRTGQMLKMEPGPRLTQFLRLGGGKTHPFTRVVTTRGEEPAWWVPLPSGTYDLRTRDGFVLWSWVPERIESEEGVA